MATAFKIIEVHSTDDMTTLCDSLRLALISLHDDLDSELPRLQRAINKKLKEEGVTSGFGGLFSGHSRQAIADLRYIQRSAFDLAVTAVHQKMRWQQHVVGPIEEARNKNKSSGLVV